MRWSCALESVRKDVERTFGILKMRFRFFKNAIELHSQDDIDNAFFTCCILHNMLLQYDGLDTLWMDEDFWKALDPDDDYDNDYDNFRRQDQRAMGRLVHKLRDETWNYGDDVETEIESEFFTLRHRLIVHYAEASRKKEIEWLN